MTNPIRVLIRELLDKAADAGDVLSPAVIEHQVRTQHPDLFAEYATELAGKGVRQTAREMLTATARDQQVIAGLELPQWFTVPDAIGGYEYVPAKWATLAHHDADVEVKRSNASSAAAELRKAQARHDVLWTAPGAHAGMLVVDAAQLLAQGPTP